ncbi:MAG: hypothetical protein AAF431_11840 [Pseudomonadota bacterium]
MFKSPESAIVDVARERIYVSNVNGYTENGLGYLTALDLNGEAVAEKWIEGINAPTGLAISGDTLYVVDFNRLLEIDISQAKVRATYPVTEDNPGLNDVTVSPSGDVFVSSSNLAAIYKLQDGSLQSWVQDDQLKWANGVLAEESRLIVAGFHLMNIDLASKVVTPFSAGAEFQALEDLESIEADGDQGYYLTQIGDKPIMHISEEGKLSVALTRKGYSADIDYQPKRKMMVVPRAEDTVYAYRVDR